MFGLQLRVYEVRCLVLRMTYRRTSQRSNTPVGYLMGLKPSPCRDARVRDGSSVLMPGRFLENRIRRLTISFEINHE